MSCDCDCAGCKIFCDCERCTSAQTSLLEPPANRRGLDAIQTRIGDYNAFFADAMRRLSSRESLQPRPLGTRDPADPTIAYLDAWSVGADVLTFYRERLTQGGYLRTATDEHSLRELANMIGYKPRPGVAATVHLAYLLDPSAKPANIDPGAKAQTVPLPGEKMQTFETNEKLAARAEWSQMKPRQSRPPNINEFDALTRTTLRLAGPSQFVRPGERVLFVFGMKLAEQVVREVLFAKTNVELGFVELTLKPKAGLVRALATDAGLVEQLLKARSGIASKLADEIEKLESDSRTPNINPGNYLQNLLSSYLLGGSAADIVSLLDFLKYILARPRTLPSIFADEIIELDKIFKKIAGSSLPTREEVTATSLDDVLGALRHSAKGDQKSKGHLVQQAGKGLNSDGAARIGLVQAMIPVLKNTLYSASRAMPASSIPASAPSVHLLKTVASPFGAAAPPKLSSVAGVFSSGEWPINPLDTIPGAAFLDTVADAITADSFAIIDSPLSEKASGNMLALVIEGISPQRMLRFARVRSAQTIARGSYSISGRVTKIELADADTGNPLDVLSPVSLTPPPRPDLNFLRNTLYLVQSEPVDVAGDDIGEDVKDDEIQLATLYDGLEPGRWVCVAGERTDIKDKSKPPNPLPGIRAAELRTIREVAHIPDVNSPGDSPHTFITLDKPLAYSYKLSNTTVYGNVVEASHGETTPAEVLGSGNAAVTLPKFQLKRSPLTYVTAPTSSGVEGTETIRVNSVRYHRADSLLDTNLNERTYELADDESGVATLTFKSRLPTGQENVSASYRVGIGSEGNVKAEQISLLASRPLGVQGVINPLQASGGADRDGPERIRRNAPLAALALYPRSRLVSVSDHAAFALRFAGIGHADARKLSGGWVHVTVAGVDDIPLDQDGELLTNLRSAYEEFGDPSLQIALSVRELKALVLQAKVVAEPDADPAVVETQLREKLLDLFSFERSRLAQTVYLSRAVAAMQKIPGVDWVDISIFDGISESVLLNKKALEDAVKKPLGREAAVSCAAGAASQDDPDRAKLWEATYGVKPRFLPAQLTYLVRDVPSTLALNVEH